MSIQIERVDVLPWFRSVYVYFRFVRLGGAQFSRRFVRLFVVSSGGGGVLRSRPLV